MARYHVHGYTLSLGTHAIALVVVGLIVARAPDDPSPGDEAKVPARLVWPVPGSGSLGGSGQRSPSPPRPAESVGRRSVSLASVSRTLSNPIQIQEVPPPPTILLVPNVAAGLSESIGVIGGRPGSLDSLGPGDGPNAGDGRGKGIGSDIGDRIGSGGDDGAQPGNGVSWPRLVREVKPNYTADAMRAQIEGLVELEIVVLADGTVGRVSLVRSLDSRFGLDQEAINAVRNWRFEPGRRLGKAIPVRVGVELSFNLR
jgi:periplasmic protein TonB